MYGLFTYIWVVLAVNIGTYIIRWASGIGKISKNNCLLTYILSGMKCPKLSFVSDDQKGLCGTWEKIFGSFTENQRYPSWNEQPKPLKLNGWKMIFRGKNPFFRGKLAVSFTEYNALVERRPTHCTGKPKTEAGLQRGRFLGWLLERELYRHGCC